MTINIAFSTWLEDEIKQQYLTPAQLATKSGVGPDIISRILNQGRGPSNETLSAIARALGYPDTYVFRVAKILEPESEVNPFDEEIKNMFTQLSPEEKKEIKEYTRFTLKKRKG